MALTQKEIDVTYNHLSPILIPHIRSGTLSMHRTHGQHGKAVDMKLHMQTHCGPTCTIAGLYL